MAHDLSDCGCGVCSGFMMNTALTSMLASSSGVTTESTSNISSEDSISVTRKDRSGNAYINSLTWNNQDEFGQEDSTPIWNFTGSSGPGKTKFYYYFNPGRGSIANRDLGLWDYTTENWPTNVTESAIAALEAFTACFRDSQSSENGYGIELERIILDTTVDPSGVTITDDAQAVDVASINFMYSNDPSLSTYDSSGLRTGIILGLCGPPGLSGVLPTLSGALIMNQFGDVDDPATGTPNPGNANWTATASINPGGGFFGTVLHELGHGFGMAHPFDDGGGSSGIFPGVTGSGPYTTGDNGLNITTYTIMSYNRTQADGNPYGRSSSGTQYGSGWPATPMAFDYATLSYLYGFNPTYNTGDQTYVIADGTNTGGYTCITSAGSGTNDLIIYNGSSAVTIDLRPASLVNAEGGGGYVSKLNGNTNVQGYTIGADMQVEKATGGDGDDTIWQVDSQTNIIDGRAGIDQVNYNDIEEAYNINLNQTDASGNHTIVARKPISANSLDNASQSLTFQVPRPIPDSTNGTTINPTIAYFCYTHPAMTGNFTIIAADETAYNSTAETITVKLDAATALPYYWFYDSLGASLNSPTTPMELMIGKKYQFVRSNEKNDFTTWNPGDHPFNIGSIPTTNDVGLGGDRMYVSSTGTGSPVVTNSPISAAEDRLYNIETLGFQYGNVASTICFRKGTSILCLVDGEEKQVPIQKIKKGDLVKTYKYGYKEVEDIESTYSSMSNELNSLYKLPMGTYSGMTDDLYITGGHSLLVDKLSENEHDNMRRISWKPHLFKVADKHKLLAMYNPKMKRVDIRDKIYHIVLEQINDHGPYSVYGVYANGVLAESCSRRSLQMHRKRSGKQRRITSSA